MGRTHRRRQTGLLSLGALMVGVVMTPAEAHADPTPASEFKERVQKVADKAGKLSQACENKHLVDLHTQLRKAKTDVIQKIQDEITAEKAKTPAWLPNDAWVKSTLETLRQNAIITAGEEEEFFKDAKKPGAKTFEVWIAELFKVVNEAALVVPARTPGAPTMGAETMCDALCGNKPTFNLCGFSKVPLDPAALAAIAVDGARIDTAFDYASQEFVLKYDVPTWPKVRDDQQEQSDSSRGGEKGAESGELPPLESILASALGGPAAGAAAMGAPFLDKALQGVAKFIVDRAKQESIGWFLDTTGDKLCGARDKQDLWQAEVGAYWMPQLCTLATTSRLSHYGVGDALLEHLKGSVKHDVSSWPGAFAGLAMGGVFWADARTTVPEGTEYDEIRAADGFFACSTLTGAKKTHACTALDSMRVRTGEHFTSLLDGGNPLPILGKWGTDINKDNRYPTTTGVKLYSKPVQLLACAASLPVAYSKYHEQFAEVLPNDSARSRWASIAALASAPACFTILGKGISDKWIFFGGSEEDPTVKTALDAAHRIEHVSTILRLGKVEMNVNEVVQSWKQLEDATKEYAEAVKEAAKALEDLRKNPPVPPKSEITDPAAWKAQLAQLMASERLTAQQKHVGAALHLAKASLEFGRAGTALIRTVNAPSLLPGLYTGGEKHFSEDLEKNLEALDKQLDRVERDIAALESALMQDWSTLTADLMASLRVSTAAGNESKKWQQIEKQLARPLALIIAILQAKDGDAVARALDAVAAPPGGWRTKGVKGNTTFSIVAHPGLLAGFEWRWGTYGVIREHGTDYWVAPTLALPVGAEVAFGNDCPVASPFSVFVSVLDPAAFLQYDEAQDARLPGPSIKTALAPGLGLRAGFKDTPFGLMLWGTYRPGLRQWDAAVSGTGATAVQLNLLLSVDVTLFSATREGEK